MNAVIDHPFSIFKEQKQLSRRYPRYERAAPRHGITHYLPSDRNRRKGCLKQKETKSLQTYG